MIALLLILACGAPKQVRPAPTLMHECWISRQGERCWLDVCHESTGVGHETLWWVQASDGWYQVCDLEQHTTCAHEIAAGEARCR